VRKRLTQLLIVLCGIVLGQLLLYGPSLLGSKVLLPLDILAGQNAYIPRTTEISQIQPKDKFLVDLVFLFEPSRRFANSQIHAGRFPSWAPYHYAGAPFMGPRFSPFMLLQYLVASPVILAWAQMLQAIVAGIGGYAFFRRVLRVGFWPAAICAWCYPITAFFLLWQGFATSGGVYWLPWLLLAVDASVRHRSWLGPIGLAVTTALALVSGHVDVGAQVVLGSGLFGLWRLVERASPGRLWARAGKSLMRLSAGWLLGVMLAAPAILPVLAYTRTSARMAYRAAGREERPPVGLAELPELALPDLYGSTQLDSFYLFPEGQQNLQESISAAYSGAAMLLLFAPLAWCSRRHRSLNLFWAGLALFGLSWCLNVPGVVSLLRLPGLKLLSHDRLVFLTCFAILGLAATGLDALRRGAVKWRTYFWFPIGILVALLGWSIFRSLVLPRRLEVDLPALISQGQAVQDVHDSEGVARVQSWFVTHHLFGAFWCGVALAGWFWLRKRSRLAPAGSIRFSSPQFCSVATVLMADLLWFGSGRSVQTDWALYYPRVPVLESVAKDANARMIGFQCLPPALSAICGLRDVRGYDSVDPASFMDLLAIGCQERGLKTEYAAAQWLAPKATITPDGNVRLSPVLDMLAVRYVILRGTPRPEARSLFQGEDYWVEENPAALPRVFVPKRVELAPQKQEQLAKLSAADFNPREVAYVESAVDLPQPCEGEGQLVDEIPTHLKISLKMKTPGLVVLSDLWDKGWKAYLNGKPVPVLRVNHALRGVLAPAGESSLEFKYQPDSIALAMKFSIAAAVVLALLALAHLRPRKA
jgi:hypothetical protein